MLGTGGALNRPRLYSLCIYYLKPFLLSLILDHLLNLSNFITMYDLYEGVHSLCSLATWFFLPSKDCGQPWVRNFGPLHFVDFLLPCRLSARISFSFVFLFLPLPEACLQFTDLESLPLFFLEWVFILLYFKDFGSEVLGVVQVFFYFLSFPSKPVFAIN